MATIAQINANQINAQSSTGPRTAEGKARSDANGVSFGLFSSRGLVRPEEIGEHDQLRAGLAEELKPDTILEHAMAAQILHAMWRLRRCAQVEESLAARTGDIDPMDNPETLPTQTAIDRARAQSNVALRRSMAELRRLQTERFLRTELPQAEGLVSNSPEGLISQNEVARAQPLTRRADGLHRFETILHQADEQVAAMFHAQNTNQTQSGLPRGAGLTPYADVHAAAPVVEPAADWQSLS
jgi:hypothetical protein